MDGTDEAPAEAASYERKLKALDATRLPRDAKTGLPIFDLMLVGVGDDGHVGSLYPNRAEVIDACGVSEKYPKGKSEAMGRGIEGDETPSTFPAVGLRAVADWIVDNAAAATLSVDYAECFSLDMSRGDCNP